MLAERKRKQKWSLNPRGKDWSEGNVCIFVFLRNPMSTVYRFQQVWSKNVGENGMVAR